MDAVYQLKLERIASGGDAVARLEGKTVFVEGGAPDETICCRITEAHASWARAKLLEITDPSPARIGSRCAHYGTCGGCSLQHIDYNTQLTEKTALLTESFTRIGGFSPPEPEIFPSPPWEYRNRLQFHCLRELAQSADSLNFGLKARNSGEIIPVSDCPVADPGIRAVLQEAGTKIRPPPEKDRFTVYSRGGLLLNEGGQERGKTRLLDREVLLDAGVFFQSNAAMLEKLIVYLQETAAGADKSLPMADLYSGVGTFALFLGGMFPKTDLVEENKRALAVARENLHSFNAAFSAMRDTAWAKTAKRRYGFIVADPPRSGLSPKLAAWLAENGPPLLAYVSCDPAALARDSKILTTAKARGGYQLQKLALFDFYPQTTHIETAAVFTSPPAASS